jgi:hypothetical protein
VEDEDEEANDEAEGEAEEGDEAEEEAEGEVVMETPSGHQTSVSSTGSSSFSVTPRTLEVEAAKKYKTSHRTGLTEQQLIVAGRSDILKSDTLKKRGIIDKQVAAIEKEERSTMDVFLMMMQQSREAEARREERQAQRDENSQRMMMTFMAAMMNNNKKD